MTDVMTTYYPDSPLPGPRAETLPSNQVMSCFAGILLRIHEVRRTDPERAKYAEIMLGELACTILNQDELGPYKKYSAEELIDEVKCWHR